MTSSRRRCATRRLKRETGKKGVEGRHHDAAAPGFVHGSTRGTHLAPGGSRPPRSFHNDCSNQYVAYFTGCTKSRKDGLEHSFSSVFEFATGMQIAVVQSKKSQGKPSETHFHRVPSEVLWIAFRLRFVIQNYSLT